MANRTRGSDTYPLNYVQIRLSGYSVLGLNVCPVPPGSRAVSAGFRTAALLSATPLAPIVAKLLIGTLVLWPYLFCTVQRSQTSDIPVPCGNTNHYDHVALAMILQDWQH
eukprot:6161599-Pleurochrysis_carterae.AAC.1